MKKKPGFHALAVTVIFIVIVCFWYFLRLQDTYLISEYFPLNENDKYIYHNLEGAEEGEVAITVKDVKVLGKEKRFSWLWEGRYNDRLQALRLTPRGLSLYENKHLVGEEPMKVVRVLSPPILMIPSSLKRNILLSSVQSIYSYGGRFLESEKIEADISFLGIEDIDVEAGRFRCIHFFVRHIYKDADGKSKHTHIYNFWIAKGVGIVKYIHIFTPFLFAKKIKPEEKTIMNRYGGGFISYFELKKAIIGGKTVSP